ncbi:MAG TPA: PIG-L family deacetylase [Pyrinomonadaceae bacterium]
MNKDKLIYKTRFQISDFRFQIKKISVFICVHLWLISLCLFAPLREISAQVRPVYDYGAVGLSQLLKRLNTTASVMHIGAHPDDEDSALLAYLARGENARTAYLSLTRGDGGQNIIGSELFESLGVIRTEELLQARRLDGAEQYFTRAFDYGFSKTLEEARAKWDEKIILCDAVSAIRRFRPLVVISRFTGTPADGHGQHQFAGYIAPLAVKAAADAGQCKDAGAPWQVLKFYVSQGFRSQAVPTLRLNTGRYDYLLGRSFFEIAMEGRSQHKTQEQGVLELKGERFSGLNLIESKVPKVEKETSVFDGIDTSLENIPRLFGKDYNAVGEDTKARLKTIRESAERAAKEYNPNEPQKIVSALARGSKAADELFSGYLSAVKVERGKEFDERRTIEDHIFFIANEKLNQFTEAIKLAAGIQIEALADRETVAPNETFTASVKVFYPENPNIKVEQINLRPLHFQRGVKIASAEEPKNDSSAFVAFSREKAVQAAYFNVSVPYGTELTQPYFLKAPRANYLYAVQDLSSRNQPFQYPLAYGAVNLEINGEPVFLSQTLEYRYADDVRGEVRRDLNVVPKVSLSLDQKLLIIPLGGNKKRQITMSVTNNSSGEIKGQAKLNLPERWKASPAAADFDLKTKGAKTSIVFDVTIPVTFTLASYKIGAEAMLASGEKFTQEMHTLAYPHIRTHRFYTPAETAVNVFDLKSAPVKVGYIMGSGDAVPEAIQQMGFSVQMLNENDLASGNLARFDVIVVGIRAFQVRQDLISNNQRVLEYVRNGGNLIVQYQRPEYENLLPFPAKIGARVADENARVSILEPQNPVFNFPNKIADEDFENWVQERNLYSFTTFDANYKPLLEAHDANEAENKGGLVVAEIGKGKYIYTSYAFFRQLPAGVPGAYRIFANLLSLPKSGNPQKAKK